LADQYFTLETHVLIMKPPAPKSGSKPKGASTAFIAGIGTGGPSGTARFLKEKNPTIKVIGR